MDATQCRFTNGRPTAVAWAARTGRKTHDTSESVLDHVTSELLCSNCTPSSPRALATVLSALVQVPDKQVCVWHVGSGSGNTVREERLIKALVSSRKTIASFKSDQVDAVPPICRQSVLVTQVLGCRGLLAPSLPLTVEHHFYVIFPGLLDIDELGSCSGQFGNARAAFISLRDARVFSLSSPLFPSRTFVASDLSSLHKHDSKERANLKGRQVNVATFNCPPFVVIANKNDLDNITGIEWKVMKNIALMLNFTIKLVPLKGNGRWGTYVNGSWTGGITRAVIDGDAEIGICNMWYKPETYMIMDFAAPMDVVKFTFIVPRPRPLQHNWKALVQVFTTVVWILILIFYIFYSIVYWKFVNLYHRRRTRPGLAKYFLTMFGILMGTHWPPLGGRGSTRILVTWWSMFVLLLTSCYNSSIASRLTVQGYEQRINTVQQLVEQNFHWSDVPGYNSFDRLTYFNFVNVWQREWVKRYLSVTATHMKEALDSGQFAFPIQVWGDRLLFFNVDGIDNQRDLTNMRVLKEKTASTFVSIMFAKRSPLSKAGKIAFLRISGAGLVSLWTKIVSRGPENKYVERLLHEDEGRSLKRLGMKNLKTSFFILATGLFVSLLVFLCERFWEKRKILKIRNK